MKILELSALFLLGTLSAALGQRPEVTPISLHKTEQASPAQPIQRYQEVLSHVPADFRNTKANTWTRIQREEVNTVLKETLIEHETPAKLRLKVVDIADWGGWTFYANIPNQEGYPIRVFGKFTDAWKAKFTTLKRGDTVLLEGVLSSVTYRDLWNKFTLSICLKDCTFIKLAPLNAPSVSL